MVEIESSWMEGFYSHFIGRDFAYFIAGGFFISIFEYAFWGKLVLPNHLSLELIGFLAISYLIGLAFNEIGGKIISFQKYADSSLYKEPYNYNCRFVVFQDLIEFYDKRILNQYERYVYQSVLGASVGVSFLFGGVIMTVAALCRYISETTLPSVCYAGLTIILFIFGGYLLYYGKRSFQMWQQEQKHLVDGIKVLEDKRRTESTNHR